MTDWKKEICGEEYPEALELVSPDTYIERRGISYVEATEENELEMPAHFECESRFITVDEYNMLYAMAGAVTFKQETEIIDAYTLQLIEEGTL